MFRGKKLTALILAAVLICTLASCGKKKPADSGLIIDYKNYSYDPPKTVSPDYVMSVNPLVISYSEKEGGYIIISGLTDKTVEARVNQAIKDEYNRLSDPDFLPPVTGIKALEKKYAGQPSETGIYCSTEGNTENLLSVAFYYGKSYGDPESMNYAVYGTDSVHYHTYITFDLSTGKKLKLSDVFIDGVDPVKYVNAALVKLISGSDNSSEGWGEEPEDSGLRLVGAFRGIREDQPFYVSSEGGLTIILDERNPEFALDPTYFADIDISRVSAISSKFGSKSGLYEKKVTDWIVVERSFPAGSVKAVNIAGTRRYNSLPYEGEQDAIQFWSGVLNYDGLSASINRFLSLSWMNPVKVVQDAKVRAAELLAEDPGVTGYFDIHSSAGMVGEYINVSAGYYEYFMGSKEKVLYEKEFNSYACYKEGSDTQLKIQDLFWKSDKAAEALCNAQIEVFKKDSQAYYKYNYNVLARLAQELTDHISGFNIRRGGLFIAYDTDIEEIVAKYFPKAGANYRQNLAADIGFLDYGLIGYENLRMFK